MNRTFVIPLLAGFCWGLMIPLQAQAIDQRDFHESADRYRETVRDFESSADRSGLIDKSTLRIIDQLEDLSFDLERASSKDMNESGTLILQAQQQHALVEAAVFGSHGRGQNAVLRGSWTRVCSAYQVMVGHYKLALGQPIVRPNALNNPPRPSQPAWGNSGHGHPGWGQPSYPPAVQLGYTGNLVPGVEIMVTSVANNSLGQQMGLMAGDRIVAINSTMPVDQAGIASALASQNGQVTLNVYRGGTPLQLRGQTGAGVGSFASPSPNYPPSQTSFPTNSGVPGLANYPLTPGFAASPNPYGSSFGSVTAQRPPLTPGFGGQSLSLGIQAGSYRDGFTDTLVIESVDPRGRGAASGLQVGDRILAVNNRAVSTIAEYQAAAVTDATGTITLTIDRPNVGRQAITLR